MAREFIVPGQMITGSGAHDMAQDTLGTLGKNAYIDNCTEERRRFMIL